jgi:lipid A ethanolaminephosphotransferase
MLQNVLRTDAREASELLSWRMAGWILLWSAIPVAFIWWIRIERLPWLKTGVIRAGSVAGALVLALCAILLVSRDVTSFMRNHREVRYLITPGNVIYGLAVNSMSRVKDVNAIREQVGLDAAVIRVANHAKPRVLVLVVGETARAANFSLLGYPRETNPELGKLNVTAFSDVTSCGTSTEISVPCMFSQWGREDYDEHRIRNSESLLDVLQRAGYIVKWIDNQSGCKGVCKGVQYVKIDPKSSPDLCDGKECHDGVLVRHVQAELGAIEQDTVLVVHMLGNHGPAYFRRYPPEFRRFLPDCATAQLRDCTREQVVNAYDNAILYTDHVLAGFVQVLMAQSAHLDGAMIYISDHGESLGEKGLYLHGIPYAIAPTQQTHVPLIAWLSPALTMTGDVSARCLQARVHNPYSHDNLFHSVLGLMNVKTAVYREDRDLFDGCRGGVYSARRAPR